MSTGKIVSKMAWSIQNYSKFICNRISQIKSKVPLKTLPPKLMSASSKMSSAPEKDTFLSLQREKICTPLSPERDMLLYSKA